MIIMKKNILVFLVSLPVLLGCDDVFFPAPENFQNLDHMYTDSRYAQGVLLHTYRMIPDNYNNSEYATDDAVTNVMNNNYLQMATGSWTSANNPVNQWTDAFGAIQQLNVFLERVDSVHWAADPEASELFRMRMRGEAHGMRALFMYYLLRAHAGYGAESNELLGVPIITKSMDIFSDFNLERASFEACVQLIYDDLDSAEFYLPVEYNNIGSSEEIPERYRSVTELPETYNRVMGEYARQLFNGLIAQAFRARVALLAASPAFQDPSNSTTWEDAANFSAALIDYAGGVGGLDPDGETFFDNRAEIDALGQGVNPEEIIWRTSLRTNNSDMQNLHYPPSLFGQGNMNPSQNLVDAFPMSNGYPIDDNASNYDSSDPYAGRDPRLAHYIIYNGNTAGVSNTAIQTGSESTTADAINRRETSTRTGYYMKKRLRMDVNRNPASITGKNHYTPRIRYTEMFLTYAEAANEAWGPKGTGTHGFSAYDVIKAIRTRAGVGVSNGDPYLEECALDKDKMRELIRNERRIELSFEGFRFWDLRRWKADLNVTVKGMDASNGYSIFDVEERDFEDYMYYGPVPKSEMLKYSRLEQNKGWN